jgi:hypothetical protein
VSAKDWLITWKVYGNKPGPLQNKAKSIIAELEATLTSLPDLPNRVPDLHDTQSGLFDRMQARGPQTETTEKGGSG